MVSFRMSSPVVASDDSDVEVVDEDDHAGAAVLGAESDVVHAAVDAQSDLAVVVDDVVADAVMAVAAAVAGDGFGSPVIGVGGGASLG